jgi:hypothetical protein
MMRYLRIVAGLLLLFSTFGGTALAADVGSVKNCQGQAVILRGPERLPAEPGNRLMVMDTLQTGKDGAMGIILRDDTVISMGPDSEMVLAEFLFHPKEQQMGMLARFLRGTFTYLSGMIAKLDPESVKLETPVGMVAVRGTHLLIKVDQ